VTGGEVVGSDLVGILFVGEKVGLGTGEDTIVEGALTGIGAGASDPLQDGVPQVSSSPLHCPPPPLGLCSETCLGLGFGLGFCAGFLGLGFGLDPPPPPPPPLLQLPSGDHHPGTVGATDGGWVGGWLGAVVIAVSITFSLVGEGVGGGVLISSFTAVHFEIKKQETARLETLHKCRCLKLLAVF
jgi:hypothetical protein